jgi:hypothetical protein
MALCPRCNKRAAKRYCPALRTNICAPCCAQERMIELACPEGCQYLRDGRAQAAARERELHLKEVAEGRRKPEISDRLRPALYAIDIGIIDAQRDKNAGLGDLDDSELLAAVDITIKNLEVEESGLIYVHRASSPRIEEVSRRIRAGLDEMTKKAEAEDRLRRVELVKVLNIARGIIESHIRRNEAEPGPSRSYIRYVSLFIPWPKEATTPLIIG